MLHIKYSVAGAVLVLAVSADVCSGQRTEPSRDQHGDVLPAGAVARLGSVRWRHNAPVRFVAFAPNGRSVLSAGNDGFFRVRAYPSGRELRRFGRETLNLEDSLSGQRSLISHIKPLLFAISKDSRTAAMLGDREIAFYDVATGKQLPALELPKDDRPQFFDFSPDGKHLAAVEYDGKVNIWDIVTTKLLRSFGMGPNEERATMLAFAPDGKRLLTGAWAKGDDKEISEIRHWDPLTGQKIRADQLQAVAPGLYSAAGRGVFTPDGKLLALPRGDHSILLVETETGLTVRTLPGAPKDSNTPLFSRDGKTLFKRLHGATVAVCDVATGKVVNNIGPPLPKERDREFFLLSDAAMALSPDGQTLALCCGDNCIHFVDVASGKEKPIAGHVMAVDRLQFTLDSKQMWTFAIDRTIGHWECPSGKELAAPDLPQRRHFCMSAEGKLALQCAWGEGLVAIDLTTGKKTTCKLADDNESHNWALAADGNTAMVRWREKIELHSVPSLQIRYTIPVPTSKSVYEWMALSSESNWLAASHGRAVAVWKVANTKKSSTIWLPEGTSARTGAFTPDGRCLVLDVEDGTVLLAEIATGQVRRTYGVKADVGEQTTIRGHFITFGLSGEAKVAVTPDGKQLVHAGPDRVVRVWDIFTGKELASFKGHDGAILALAISPDGKFAATASTDTTVLLWALPSATTQAKPADLDNAFRLNFATTTEAPSWCTSSIP
jgi:WD40 repeat protein